MAATTQTTPEDVRDNAHSGTVRLTTGQAVVRFLQAQYSERDGVRRRFIPAIFGIFGHGNVTGLSHAIYEYGQDLPYYQPCNEQGMVHTAMGFAKASQRLATLACTTSIGPGATNMITGAANATINRIPVLLLPSDTYATRHQGPVLQQLEHPLSGDITVNDCFRPVSRYFDRVSRPEQLLRTLPEAMRVLTDPVETGAVTISLPQDVQSHAYDFPVQFFKPQVWRIDRRLPDPQRIEEAIELLQASKRPLIIAGGGVLYSQAGKVLQEFAEEFGIPVGETPAGKGAMRRDSPIVLGGIGVSGTDPGAQVLLETDLVFCIGTRLTDFITGSQSAFQNPQVKFISINVASHDAYKENSLPILADAKLAIEALGTAARKAGIKANDLTSLSRLKKEWQDRLHNELLRSIPGEAMSQGELLGLLNQAARPGDTVVAAAGSAPGDILRAWDATGGRNAHIEYGYSCMGYEIPAGLGVRLSQSEGEVYILIGDGTYLMNPTELVTALREGLKITIVLAENHGYQCIRQLEVSRTGRDFGNQFFMRDLESNTPGTSYVELDFAMNGRSLGARDWHVRTSEELLSALEEARLETKPCIIVIKTEPFRYMGGSGVWWDVEPPEVTNDPIAAELRIKYERDRARLQKFYY